MSLAKVFANPTWKPDIRCPSLLTVYPVHIQLFQHSSTRGMVRMPVSVYQVANLVDSFTFKALVGIFRCIEQNACSSQEDGRSITDKSSSLTPSLLTDSA